MPFYQVYHTYPLTQDQRQSIATAITTLHCSTFNTPSFFVHVNFVKEEAKAADGTYFMAGKPHSRNSNRIVAVVRTSSGRTKADFDALAAKVEDAWDEAVRGEGQSGEESKGPGHEAKRLLMVVFTPMIAVREGGLAIPEAGHEEEWLRQQLPFFKEMSESRGLQDFTDLLEELKHRGTLKEA